MNASLWEQAMNIEDRVDGYEEPGPGKGPQIEALIEKSKNGLLAPSEVVLLGRALNVAIDYLVDEEQVSRDEAIQWIESALQ